LRTNPFDIKAVEKYGIIPVSTFIGREENRNELGKIIQTRSHSLSLIIAEKGIGKTSLGNVVRADLSEKYFITLSEIDTQSDWSSTDFIFHALGNIYETTSLIGSYEGLPKNYTETCKKIHEELKGLFEDESSNFGVQVAGFGVERGRGRGPGTIAISFLKIKVKKIIAIVNQNGYSGLILQFNNLDNIEEEKKLSQVLADLRDFLLTDNCHFIFLGNKTMEACFKSNNKVNDCISHEVQLGPLIYSETKKILERRYTAFKIPQRNPVNPVLDDAVEVVYALYDGNIRQIFYSLDAAVRNSERILGCLAPLDAYSIQKVLFILATERIQGGLQPKALHVLEYILERKKDVTNTEITKKLKLKSQNTSKYLNQLKNNNLVVALNREGRNIHYKAVNEARWLLLNPGPGKQSTLPETS
jgi:DNA-binding transcriptional ArsR family regulator